MIKIKFDFEIYDMKEFVKFLYLMAFVFVVTAVALKELL